MEAEIDADAEVGGKHNADFLCRPGDGGFAGVVKTGGADDGFDAVCCAVIKQRQGGVGAAEVDEYVAAGQGGGDVVADAHAGVDAAGVAGIQADFFGAAAGQRAGKLGGGVGGNGFNQHPPHAAGHAGQRDFQAAHCVFPSCFSCNTRRACSSASPSTRETVPFSKKTVSVRCSLILPPRLSS